MLMHAHAHARAPLCMRPDVAHAPQALDLQLYAFAKRLIDRRKRALIPARGLQPGG